MKRPSVVLFDIDGTLITSKGAGRRAVVAAFEGLFGRPDAIDGLSLGGMTDRAIMRLGLRAIRAKDSEAAIDAVMEAYLQALRREIEINAACRALPGVIEAVDACLHTSDLATGLGTGNVREGARIKLSAAGLMERFAFGGFGCDGEARDVLLRVGAERGARSLGLGLGECRVVIVGDTPRDVTAARAIGAECVGVATGAFDVDVLLDAGADRAFSDLRADGALEAILG